MCHCLYFGRETDVIIPQLEEEELHHGSSNGKEQNRTCSTRRSKELGSKPINLTANGHPSVGVKEVGIKSKYNIGFFLHRHGQRLYIYITGSLLPLL